ncbi:MAG: ATP-binding protein [Nanoarchaeota archaeon]|nr:ATP-binding protein [Nanoarchaeota archaeon]MCA9497028.1 ATP-binding protein [Nanoarchaeota archaeon]
MKIASNLRIFITGKTQSGKSYLSAALLSKCQNRIIYDLKRKDFNGLGVIIHNLADLKTAIKNGCNKIIYQPYDLSEDHFNYFCGFVFTHLKNIMLCVDEVHKFCTKYKIPSNFNSIVTIGQGDPYNIGVIAITQRPANVHNDVISSSTIIISFRLNLKSDAEAVTGIDANAIQKLPHRHFLVFDDRDEDGKAKLHNPI